jgi:AcrR family transcriptional regulator
MASRRTLQKEATRDHLYATALHLFEARGYEAVSIDDIVRATGVARGTFYFHFARKDDLLLEMIRRSDQHIVGKMESVAIGRPLPEALRATTDGFADVWTERRPLLPHAGAVALRRIAEVESEREREPLRIHLVRHVEAAVKAGELRSLLPVQMLADVFLLDVFAALMAWAILPAPAPDLRVVLAAVIDLFLHGARGAPAVSAPAAAARAPAPGAPPAPTREAAPSAQRSPRRPRRADTR